MVVSAGFLWSDSSFRGDVPEEEANRKCTGRSHHLAPGGPGADGWRPGRGGAHPARAGQAATGEDHGWRLPCSLPWLSVPVTAPREPPLPGPWVQALRTPSSPRPLPWPLHAADHSWRDAVRFWGQPEASLVASAPALAEPRAVPREAWLPGSRGPRGRASQGSRGPGKKRTQEATRWTQLGPQASDPQSSRLSPSLEWSPPWASVPCAVWIPNPQDCEQIRPRLGVIYEAAIGNWKKIPCQCKNLIYTYLWWREVTPLEAQMGTLGVPSTGRTTQGSEPAPVVWADKFRRELWSVAFTFLYLLLFLWWQCFSWSRGKAKYR